MASKAIFFSFFVVSAVCLSSLAGFAAADADDFDRFQIQGSVYCDTCRVQFVTRLSKFLEGNIFTHVYLCFYTCMRFDSSTNYQCSVTSSMVDPTSI